jgi:5-methylcytosine-specific restriction endonuclease McrA
MRLFGVQLWGRTDPAPVRRAMEAHRRENPTCAACGDSPVVIHHIIPVAVEATWADKTWNLMSLCPTCHITHGHAGDRGCHRYVPNIEAVLQLRKVSKI